MDEVRKSWWTAGLPHLADSLHVKNSGQRRITILSRAWRAGSISIAESKPTGSKLEETSSGPAPRRILGIRRRNFFINLTVITVLLLAFLGIGLDLALNKDNTIASSIYPGLAASSLNTTQASVHVFYQNSITHAIQYRISVNESSFSPARTLELDEPLKTNISVAATSFESQGFIFHQIFYVMNSKIMLANISCPSTSPIDCSIIEETVISTGTAHHVAKDSAIAAVYAREGQTRNWRVFFHSDDYYLSQIKCTHGVWDKEGLVVGNKAVPSSGISAVAFGTPLSIEVLYLDEVGNSIFAVQSMDGEWFSPSPITTIIPSKPLPTSILAISYTSMTDNLHAYYSGEDSQIYEFIAINASSSSLPISPSPESSSGNEVVWTNVPEKNNTWLPKVGSGAPSASTSWLDQLVFFGVMDGSLVQSRLNTTSGVWDNVTVL